MSDIETCGTCGHWKAWNDNSYIGNCFQFWMKLTRANYQTACTKHQVKE